MGLLWKHVDEKYLAWLRSNYEARIPFTNYGAEHYKPFFGSLFTVGDLMYVTQVSSPKPRHDKLKNAADFFKIYHPLNNTLLAVVNVNFMFPVHTALVEDLEYENIEKYCSFKNHEEKSKYIDLMRLEMQEINNLNITKASESLYRLKYTKPHDRISQRCFDFKNLEQAALEYLCP